MTKQTTHSISYNYIMNLVYTMSLFVFYLIAFPYVARVLGPEGTGKVAFATSLIAYFSMFAQLGIPVYGVRTCARVRDDKTELSRVTHELLFLNLCTNVITYALLFLAIAKVGRLQQDAKLFFICSAIILLTSLSVDWLYKALEQYRELALRSLLCKAIALVVLFCMVRTGENYLWYGVAIVLAEKAYGLINFIHMGNLVSWKPVGEYNLWRHIKPIGVIFAMAAASALYTNLDAVMLGFMTDDATVGYYNAAMFIRKALVTVIVALAAVLIPKASYYVQKGHMDAFWEMSHKAFLFVVTMALPVMVYCILFSKVIVLFLSGPAYDGAVLPMMVLMPTVVCIGITNLLGFQVLLPLDKENLVLYSVLLGAVVDIALNLMWIPRLGATGAALGTLVAEIVVLIYQYKHVRAQFSGLVKSMKWYLYGVALLLACVVTGWMTILPWNRMLVLLVSGILFFAVYLGVLFLLGDSLLREVFATVKGKMGR